MSALADIGLSLCKVFWDSLLPFEKASRGEDFDFDVCLRLNVIVAMFESNGVTRGLSGRELQWTLLGKSKIFNGVYASTWSRAVLSRDESESVIPLSISCSRGSVYLIVE